MKRLLLLPLFILAITTQAQLTISLITNEVTPMPMAISNNAVVEGYANDTGYVYSFGGIDATKIWSGINKKSFRYNTTTGIWDTIPDLPNPNAVIAAGASYVDSIIYIMGGYQVLSNGSEISSNIVNRFDPRTNTYLSDGANIPVATDDHVQAVWNDSLIYIITGWSNTGNIPNVQIYNPSNNTWAIGTAVPNNNLYKAFGASGTIIGNTIYYHGGAVSTGNFSGQSTLRIGQIDPNDPTQITWSTQTTNFVSYRAASTNLSGVAFWLGGAEDTYNFDGIAYNGSGGVPTKTTNLGYGSATFDSIVVTTGPFLPMDLRGIAKFGSDFYIAGGMINNQQVSNKTYKIGFTIISSIKENKQATFTVYPNPTSQQINLEFEKAENRTITLLNILGKQIFQIKNNTSTTLLDVSHYPKGIYFIQVSTEKEMSSQKIVVE